jgi:hypothetical protein
LADTKRDAGNGWTDQFWRKRSLVGIGCQGTDLSPMYCMNFNPPYYQQLFENYGFKNYYNQICFAMNADKLLHQKFYDRHDECARDPNYNSAYIQKNQLEKFARILPLYIIRHGRTWRLKTVRRKSCLKMFKSMKPVLDERFAGSCTIKMNQ